MIRTIAASLTAAALLTLPVAAGTPDAHAAGTLKPCATEDSHGPCYWNAQTRGNGKGRSFTVSADNRVTYTSPKVTRVATKRTLGYGQMQTRSGRVVTIDKDGCFVIDYRDLSPKRIGDPGDGEVFCAS